MHEILWTIRGEECIEVKEEEEIKERNVQIEEEIDDETEASEMQREEDSDKEEVIAASCITIRLFDLSMECNKGPKHLLLRKEKNFNIILVKTILQNDGKIFCQFHWENNEIILRRIM